MSDHKNTGGKARCNTDPLSLPYPAGIFFFNRNNQLSLIQLMCHLIEVIAISGRRPTQTAAPTVWGWSEIIKVLF